MARLREIERLAWSARVYLLIGDEATASAKWDEMRRVCRAGVQE